MTRHRSLPLALLASLLAASPVAAQDPGVPVRAENVPALARMLQAEDARGAGEDGIQPLLQALLSDDPGMRRLAVRGLGRLEEPQLTAEITPLLSDPDPHVRAEAANALAQAVMNGDGLAAQRSLLPRLAEEPDAAVRGVVAQAIGRLPLDSGLALAASEAGLVNALERGITVDLVRGLDGFVRANRGRHRFSAETLEHLRALVAHTGEDGEHGAAAAIRRVAVAALTGTGQVDARAVSAYLSDPDEHVRRIAVAGLRTVGPSIAGRNALLQALEDPAPTVRYQALQLYAGTIQGGEDCRPVIGATGDADPHVFLLAMDVAGEACTLPDSLLEDFAGAAAALRVSERPHRAVHALVALAYNAPDRATALLPAFVSDPRWLVRAYAARTAAVLGDAAELERLALDGHANVRRAALTGLQRLQGHRADHLFISALSSEDYQLLITASGALQGTPNPAVARPALLDAFERISRQRRETSRDARMALLDRLGDFEPEDAAAARLAPYLTDFDPVVAAAAAELVTLSTGERHAPVPEPLPREPFPSMDELRRLGGTRVTFHMARGGSFAVRLFPWDAPTNAARFARLAAEGYFDGLTFHRVVPNFVIQGGSPGANEYMGTGPYSRDELTARAHRRGTVGLSTRGRDTGDAQIFVNLVDNLRLDHNYTIYGEVVEGMETVDGVLEADVIERVEVSR